MNLDKSLAFYKDRFADASDFTFVFVGSFDLADDEAAGRAVSRQPAGDAPERKLEGRRDAHAGRRSRAEGREGIGPKSEVAIVFSGPFQDDERHRILVSTMAAMLGGNLNRTLREDLGGTYGVSVAPTFIRFPAGDTVWRSTLAATPPASRT